MNNVIIQECEFKAGEYGELVLMGQPLLEGVFFDFYPKGLYGEPKEARHRENGPPLVPPPEIPNVGGGGGSAGGVVIPSMKGANAPAPTRDEESEDAEPEGLEESFAQPRMVLYVSNSPREGWKKIGDFKSHIYKNTNRVARFFRVIHPVGCPFEGKLIATAKTI